MNELDPDEARAVGTYIGFALVALVLVLLVLVVAG